VRTRFLLGLALSLSAGSIKAFADDLTSSSVVKIETTHREPDLVHPWRKHSQYKASGSGVVIEGKRILTNAHVVRHAVEILVQPNQSNEKLAATVEAIASGIDLAVLKLEDESFFDTHRPIRKRTRLPDLQELVAVYGYPQGGDDLSITRGIVSRIEYSSYWFDTEGLRIQIDAAINPGNSGGPVMVGNTMIGLAYSAMKQSDNIGYIIPCEEIEVFLRDLQDGHYDGKHALLDVVRHLENRALRDRLGIDRATTGVLITGPGSSDSAYPLKAGDVITHIGDQVIDNAGMVRAENNRLLDFHFLVQKLVSEDKCIHLKIWREGQNLDVRVPVGSERNQWLCPHLMGSDPSFFTYGPLVFSEASRELVNEITKDDDMTEYLTFRSNPLVSRAGERPATPGERLVFVAEPTFPHRIYKGYAPSFGKVVGQVNGVRVRNLKHMVEILRDSTGEFTEILFLANHPERIIFRRQEALQATEEILANNGIRSQCSADLSSVWQPQKK
jgi:S1-C subfamily serine protease